VLLRFLLPPVLKLNSGLVLEGAAEAAAEAAAAATAFLAAGIDSFCLSISALQ
jgi:hypothetical protein